MNQNSLYEDSLSGIYEDSLSGIEFSDPDVNYEEISIKKRSRGEDCMIYAWL